MWLTMQFPTPLFQLQETFSATREPQKSYAPDKGRLLSLSICLNYTHISACCVKPLYKSIHQFLSLSALRTSSALRFTWYSHLESILYIREMIQRKEAFDDMNSRQWVHNGALYFCPPSTGYRGLFCYIHFIYLQNTINSSLHLRRTKPMVLLVLKPTIIFKLVFLHRLMSCISDMTASLLTLMNNQPSPSLKRS